MKAPRVYIPDGPNMPPSPCPHCGKIMDCASGIGSKKVRPGLSVALCVHCENWNGYDKKKRLVKLDAMELLKFQLDPECARVMRVAAKALRAAKICTGRMKP